MFWGVGLGLLLAILFSVGVLTAFYAASSTFLSGQSQNVFEGSLQIIASAMITLVALSMLRMMALSQKWEVRMQRRLASPDSSSRSIFFCCFAAVLREGIEACVFITGVSAGSPLSIPLPGVIGLILGALFSYAVFFGSKPVDVRIFMYTSAFVMFAIGAGLLSRGLHEFQLAGRFGAYNFDPLSPAEPAAASLEYSAEALPVVPAWVNVYLADYRHCCAANDGQQQYFYTLLRALFGYSDQPTRLEIIGYVSYWAAAIALLLRRAGNGTLLSKAPPLAESPLSAADLASGDLESSEELALTPVEDVLSDEAASHPQTQPPQPRARGPLKRLSRSLAAMHPLRLALLCAASAVILALGLGLGLGLGLHVSAPDVPTARFTLIIERAGNATGALAPGKAQIVVNGQWPGPTLRIPLGWRMEVTVLNRLGGGEATVVHWHGMAQRGTPWADGVAGMTQCPVPDGGSLLLAFTPDRPGTFFYHGHLAGQRTDGLYGALVVEDVNARAVAEEVLLLSDFYRAPVLAPIPPSNSSSLMTWFMSPASNGSEPTPDCVVVGSSPTGLLRLPADRATPLRLRLINAASLNGFNVSVDGMPLSVIETDGFSVTPLDVPWVFIDVAQRVSVLLNWSRIDPSLSAAPALALRVTAVGMSGKGAAAAAASTASLLSGAATPFNPLWIGTVYFDGTVDAAPPSTTPPLLALPAPDANLMLAVPLPALAAPPATRTLDAWFGFANDASGVNRGYINNAAYALSPLAMAAPQLHTFLSVDQPLAVRSPLEGALIGDGANPFVLPIGAVVDLTLHNLDTGLHPFHLHGHSFWLMDASDAPPGAGAGGVHARRDVVSVPGSGWVRVRFEASNPGVWLLHCHIEWHMAAGLAATLVEAPAALYYGAATGSLSLPAAQRDNCRAFAEAATLPGAGGAAPVRKAAVTVGADD